MTGLFDWLFAFLSKAFAIPELHAILASVGVGMAMAYVLTLPMPADTAIKTAVQYGRVIIFVTVMGVALAMVPTPHMAAWAFTVAVFTPLFYEWLATIIYHRWPWLRPKVLRPPDDPPVT